MHIKYPHVNYGVDWAYLSSGHSLICSGHKACTIGTESILTKNESKEEFKTKGKRLKERRMNSNFQLKSAFEQNSE